MTYFGEYSNNKLYWLDYIESSVELPDSNWVCLCVANMEPDLSKFKEFARKAIDKEVLLFMGYGEYGKLLHDTFDEVICILETKENHEEIDMMTTWHDKESLKEVLWQGCNLLYLPERAEYENIKIVCMDLNGFARTEELKGYIKDFEMGYIPE